ncbi:carbohydrate-binding protein SusD [Niastella koreensis]|uniref:RagB/SusD domain-containing protein n=2 Tax=Niastella koreensis TaxID=354356 RepID=G8TKN0_NIAKG|nr:RagB/SusD family nutrient uptake outer membrane protein [Niastella koreensis]AEV98704.1 RagB/SusD domain-containing protein [Niastella koreensis GR20-10]OQP44945.1 carbohydrate-binding protein SusD [Niastella koreensis]
MNTIYKSCVWLLLAGSLFTSCKKFLVQTSQDEIIPTTTDDLTQLLNAEGYPYNIVVDNYTDLLTDDVQCSGLAVGLSATLLPTYTSYLNNGAPLFTFNPAMFDSTGTAANVISLPGTDSWKIYYGKIKGCNVVLDYLDKVSGNEQQKNALRGQALFLRAFYYLKLVTLYGQPYSGAGIDAATSPGVPLILSSEVSDSKPVRNTLAQVYGQVEKDLLAAADLLKNNFTPPNTFRVGHIAAYALLSRLYLYMGRDEDMDNVIKYATSTLNEKPGLTALTTFLLTYKSYDASGIYDFTKSPEVVWEFGANSTTSVIFFPAVNNPGSVMPPYSVSPDLAGLYEQGNGTDTTYVGDLRYMMYYARTNNVIWPVRGYKLSPNKTSYDAKGMRIAEVYLNRAEALARRYKKNGNTADLAQALSDLNTLRANRFDTRFKAYTPVNITDADALFNFCKAERRRELSFEENFRWVDIKRWGMTVTHHYIDANGVAADYTLPAGGNLYALPIPYTAINRNDQLTQNPR